MTDRQSSQGTAPRVVCVGETMAVLTPSGATTLDYASVLRLGVGGAESNVAVNLAARGYDVAWLSRLGSDPLGQQVLHALGAAGVNVTWVRTDSNAQTGVYFKDSFARQGPQVFYYRKHSAASKMSSADLEAWPIRTAEIVHTSGITAAISQSADEMLDQLFVERGSNGFKVSFDVNHRPSLWGNRDAAARLGELASRADIVLVGLDEAQRLWATDSAEDVAALFPATPHIVVKDGDREAVEFVLTDEGRLVHRVPAKTIEVVEAVGAGDAFAAGYLAGFLDEVAPVERLSRGHDSAVLALQSNQDYALPNSL